MKSSFFDFKIFAVPEPQNAQEIIEGEGNESVLVLYQQKQKASAEERSFLKRIMQAVQLELGRDIFLAHITPGKSVSLSAWQRQHEVDKVIVFGADPKVLGLRFSATLYHPIQHQHRQYLFADDLPTIHQERQRGEKRRATALWRALQVLFPHQKT